MNGKTRQVFELMLMTASGIGLILVLAVGQVL